MPQHNLTRSPLLLSAADALRKDGLKAMHPGGAFPFPATFTFDTTGVGLCSITVTVYVLERDPSIIEINKDSRKSMAPSSVVHSHTEWRCDSERYIIPAKVHV